MSEPKHTPTPWHVESTRYGPYVSSETDMVVAECSQRCGNKPREQADANAALIVRAVNAHEQMVGALESVAQAFAVEHIAEVIPPSVAAKVKAALRAARGEK